MHVRLLPTWALFFSSSWELGFDPFVGIFKNISPDGESSVWMSFENALPSGDISLRRHL